MIRRFTILLFHALFLIVPLFFTTANDELFEFNKIIVVYIFTTFIVGAWIVRMIVDNQIYWKKTPFDLPIGLFLLSQIVSTLFSMHPQTSFFGYYTRFNGGLLSILCYIALYYVFIQTFEKKDLAGFIGTTLYAGCITALYAFLEHFGRSPSCLFITGNFDVSCWIQDVKTRVFGTFGQPNWLAAYLIVLIPFVITRLISSWLAHNVWSKIWNVLLLTLFVSTLLFTQSRSGLLGFGAGFVLFIGVIAWNIWKDAQSGNGLNNSTTLSADATTLSKKERKKLAHFAKNAHATPLSFRAYIAPFLVTISVLLGLALTFGTPLTPSISVLITRLQQQSAPSNPQPAETKSSGGTQLEVGGTESGTIRTIVWKGALAVWKRYPIFGSGVETFAYSYYKDRPVEHNTVSEWDFLYNKAHNEFLNYLATTGAVGFLSYILMIIWVSVWLLRKSGKNPLFAGALLAGYTSLHVSNFFGFSTVVVSALFYLIPALGLIELHDADASTPPQRSTVSIGQWIGVCLAIVVSLYFASLPLRMWQADAAYAEAKRLLAADKGDVALKEIQRAMSISPVAQGEYQEELGHIASELSIVAYQQKQATLSADLGEMAIRASDEMLKLNPNHLNFYKSRARVLLTLSQIAPDLMKEVLRILTQAQELAPTDAKLYYNRGLIQDQLGNKAEAISLLQHALRIKPNYTGAEDQLKRVEGR